MRVTILLFSLLATLSQALPDQCETHFNLPYVKDGHERQKLDLYLPNKTPSNKKSPIIVWIHGGAWHSGDKSHPPGLEQCLERGMAVASINYRLSQHAIFPAQIQDCKTSIRFLRANAEKFSLDSENIGVWGASAGGHLAALLATTGDDKTFDTSEYEKFSSKPTCVCNYFGVADLNTILSQYPPDVRHILSDANHSPASKLLGCALVDNRKKAAIASPVTYISKADCPILHVHGTKDELVPYQQSVDFHAALKKSGVDSTLHTVKDAGHGNGFGNSEYQAVERFFQKHLLD